MKKAHVLKEERGALVDELRVIVAESEEESRDLNPEETARVDAINTELEAFDVKISRALKVEALSNARAENGGSEIRHNSEPESPETKAVKRYSFLRALNMSVKKKPLDGVELEMHQEAEKEAERSNLSLSGFGVPSMFFKDPRTAQRNLSAGVAVDYGNTVPTDVGQIIEYLWPRTVVQNLGATVLSGLTSNVSFPRKTAVPAATWEGETDTNAKSNPKTDTVPLAPKRLGTYVDISKQLLIQTNVPNLDNMVRRDIETAIGQALETAALIGSGADNQPEGIFTDANVSIEAIGTNGGSITWAHIVALEAAVSNKNADFGKLAYLTTPGIRGSLKTTEKASGTAKYIWENSPLSGVSAGVGEGQLNGYRAAISTLTPSDLTKGSGINLHGVVFGNWEQLLMGQFGGLDVVVDGVTQARNAMLRIVLNSWWDIAIRQSKAFAVIKDASAGIYNT